ncbi:unnamed protein product [Clonostachys chloroleuca]|uniref:AAA+ ATPase domain-containing protein n=1 Tax=Clonostachys chloroleuca TaxID=1926264 RepID=A0AA35M2E6_9HYPO|nr:unnamed protein product [Clonostachys chloroleuca]
MASLSSTAANPEMHETGDSTTKLNEKAMKVEVKYLVEKYDKQCNVYLESLKVDEQKKKDIEWWEEYVLCLVHHSDGRSNRKPSRSLRINSKPLKGVLNRVIPKYPGVSFQPTDVRVELPPHCLYHYLPELEREVDLVDESSDVQTHLKLLLDLVKKEFKGALTIGKTLLAQDRITYELEIILRYIDRLWTIFKPGDTVYKSIYGHHRAFRLVETKYQDEALTIKAFYIDYNGVKVGKRFQTFEIEPFTGNIPIQQLSIYPLSYHRPAGMMQNLLIARGRRFEAFMGRHYCEYDGVVFQQHRSVLGFHEIMQLDITGRVMVDPHSFQRFSGFTFNVTPDDENDNDDGRDDDDDDSDDYDDHDDNNSDEEIVSRDLSGNIRSNRTPQEPPTLTDNQVLIATSTICGFSFREKQWLHLFVDYLSPVTWDNDAFPRLVLPPRNKELVEALVNTHSQSKDSFDDIIRGKGKGLIFLLHGPPGVGKTLTAECVAEQGHRPLLTLSAGDLGTEVTEIEKSLAKMLELASCWHAVLLIDEADVFLEQRAPNDVYRNSIVSLFLRLLEYYQGILFLTTNRVEAFDPAFLCRIHLALRFKELDQKARKMIWETFQEKIGGGVGHGWDLEKLSKTPINGRQIKNAVKTGESLAAFGDKPLGTSTLEEVLEYQKEFDRDFAPAPVLLCAPPASAMPRYNFAKS